MEDINKLTRGNMMASELPIRARAIASTINVIRQKYGNKKVDRRELSLKLASKGIPFHEVFVEMLYNKGYLTDDVFLDKPIPYTAIIDMYDNEGNLKSNHVVEDKEVIERFKNMLLDIQFFQRKQKNYILEALLREYNILTFPKKNIPDLTKISITSFAAKDLYENLVLSYRRNLYKKKDIPENKESSTIEVINNLRLLIEEVSIVKSQSVSINDKIDFLFKHLKIRYE